MARSRRHDAMRRDAVFCSGMKKWRPVSPSLASRCASTRWRSGDATVPPDCIACSNATTCSDVSTPANWPPNDRTARIRACKSISPTASDRCSSGERGRSGCDNAARTMDTAESLRLGFKRRIPLTLPAGTSSVKPREVRQKVLSRHRSWRAKGGPHPSLLPPPVSKLPTSGTTTHHPVGQVDCPDYGQLPHS